MWIQRVGEPAYYRLWARYTDGNLHDPRGNWKIEDVVITPEPIGSIAEFDEMTLRDGVLYITVTPPATLYEAAGVIAREHPDVSSKAIDDLIAAYYREQGNLDRLLKQIDALPPSSPEIPYELLESLYLAAESMARDDQEGCWFWGMSSLCDRYRHEATKEFHESIIAIRDFKKGVEA